MPAEIEASDEFITASEAARILRRDRDAVPRIAAAAGLATQRLPGTRPRYSRTDVERLVRQSISRPTPASVA